MKQLKIYVLLAIVIALSGILLSKSPSVTPVSAHDDHDNHDRDCHEEIWQHQNWVNNTSYLYADKVVDEVGHFSCDQGWALHNTNKCKKMHDGHWQYKDADWTETTYKCPNGYSSQGHQNSWPKVCRKTENTGHWGEVQNGKCPDNDHQDEHDNHDNQNSCKEFKSSNGSCPSPTPEPTPEITPEVTPTVTPEVTPEPTTVPETPAPQPCNGCGGAPQAPSCGAAKPSTPTLISVVRNGTTAVLTWSAVTPVTYYSIVYGLQPDNFIYGAANVGNTTSYTVHDLVPGTRYYFSVRGVNDCMPSDASATGQVLGAATGQVLGLASTGNSALLYLLLSAGCASLILSLSFFRFAKP